MNAKEPIYPSAVFSFITGPVRTEQKNGRTILTHIQKFSHFGFMIHWPVGIHFWIFWKLQERVLSAVDTMEWIPGSERGLYIRLPFYRWDYDLGMIRDNGFLGMHWD